MMKYRLIPKSGKGAVWYTNSIAGKYVLAFSEDGWKTVVDIDLYDIVLN